MKHFFKHLAEPFRIKNGALLAYRGKEQNAIIPEGVTAIGEEDSMAVPNSLL